MNREIKFRAWDKDFKMFIYPKKHFAPQYKDGHIAEMYNPEENEYHIIYDDDERYVLMQYTGLVDKNGKEIYEGDVVRIKGPNEILGIGTVTWNNKSADYELTNGLDFECAVGLEGSEYEVIGNIYEIEG